MPRAHSLPFHAMLALVAFHCGGVAFAADSADEPAHDAAVLGAYVDGLVRDAMRSQHVAGATVAIVHRGGAVLVRGYGIAGLDPVRRVDPENTTFMVASVSKVFTWTLLMQHVERGVVDLDAPVNAYLPPDLRIPADGFTREIRVRDLPSHGTGFEDAWLGFAVGADPATLPSPRDYLRRHRPRRVREPGAFPTYSNYAANLTGELLVEVAGADFPTLAERSIFGPLGMKHTSFREPHPARADLPAPQAPAEAARRSAAFVWEGGAFREAPPELYAMSPPAASLVTTASDAARFMLVQLGDGALDGVRIYGPVTAAAFRTPVFAMPPGANGWAHGLMHLTLPGGVDAYGHFGGGLYGNAAMFVMPALELGVFVATNTPGGGALTTRLPAAVARYVQGLPDVVRAPVPSLDADAARYAGTYVSTRRPYAGLPLFEALESDVVAEVSVGGTVLRTSIGGGVQAWVPLAGAPPGSFVNVLGDERLTFVLDADGRALHFPTARGTSRMERVGVLLAPRWFHRAALAAALASLVLLALAFRFRATSSRGVRGCAAVAGASGLASVLALWHWVTVLDETELVFTFPDPLLLFGAWCAVLASVSAAALVLAGAANLRALPRTQAAAYVACAAVLLACARIAAAHGLLTPWIV